MMNIQSTQIVRELPPGADNPRNSEGDFLPLADGRILFAYSRYTGLCREDDCPCDIAAMFSADGGHTFSEPAVLIRAAEHGVQNIMSVSLLSMQNGDVGLFYLVKNPADGTSLYVLRRSTDGCRTFQAPVQCLPDQFAGYYIVNNCRVLRTRDGRILIPAAVHRSGRADTAYHADAVFFESADVPSARSARRTALPRRRPGCRSRGWSNCPGACCTRIFAQTCSVNTKAFRSTAADAGSRRSLPPSLRLNPP